MIRDAAPSDLPAIVAIYKQWGHVPRVAVLDGVERDLLILGKGLAPSG